MSADPGCRKGGTINRRFIERAVLTIGCGRPTVVASAGGAAELFRDGIDALGHLPGDVQSLASVLRRLSNDHDLRCRIGKSARQRSTSQYSVDRYGQEMASVFENAIV
ncbi:glycosyltransferase [Novipirellula sp. SH528]|uniref:glycosyltransferase n=1 Tax=Novipirellula sp. SH528 TaxID=3454466 RepID=UPI003F9F2120